MTHTKILPIFVLMLGAATAIPYLAIASDTPASSLMTNYIQNARTAEDHEHIAALFDLQAAAAESIADKYTDEFKCQHSRATGLQTLGVQFPSVAARSHCRKMLRHYVNEARDLRELADYHRRIADRWGANSR